ncbi:MAG: sodium:proton antiporter [Xanthomonadales bacterium]|nr:sodium:proton antiporter [Xanthomonadales bacterium]
MTIFEISSVLIVLAAAFGWINHIVLRLPPTIGLVVMGLAASLGAMGLDWAIPGLTLVADLRAFVAGIDFYEALMNGMLGFILFAGALHVNFSDLADEKWMVILTATIGLLISTFIIGFALYWLAGIPFIVALVFGSLISPTDPVAVLGMLKTIRVPRQLQTKIAGESLFNDGVAVVVFLILAAIAFGSDGGETGVADVARLFVKEALGGALLGAAAGWFTCQLLARVDEYVLEVLMTIALVMGTYALAMALHMSGPIAVVLAGLLIGNSGFKYGMSERTRLHVERFWDLIDEILNAALFLLIGIEVLAIPFERESSPVVLAAVPLVLLARVIAVGAPMAVLARRQTFSPGTLPILVWGGLRGGISVALALSLPSGPERDLLLTVTYCVVVFSILVQGLTVGKLVASESADGR